MDLEHAMATSKVLALASSLILKLDLLDFIETIDRREAIARVEQPRRHQMEQQDIERIRRLAQAALGFQGVARVQLVRDVRAN